MDEGNSEYSINFENHKKILTQSIDNFLTRQAFVDMTLVCNGGKKIRVHRAVLAACSPLFESILLDIDDQSHPVLVFNDILEEVMVSLIQFVYKGRTDISPPFTELFLDAARKLQIRGLEKQNINSQDHVPRLSVNSTIESKSPAQKKQKLVAEEKSEENSKSEQCQQLPEKLPLTIKTGTGIKVINPFAVKRLQKDSDSTSTEDDICVPGPSKINNGKEVVSSETGNVPEDDDSDIEFIEDNLNPSIVVINDTQLSNTEKWYTKEPINHKRSLAVEKQMSDVEYDTDDSEVRTSRRKKRKDNVASDSEESTKDGHIGTTNSRHRQNLSDSESPELITPIAMKDLPKAMVDTIKEEYPTNFSETEYLQKPFESLGRYCVICRVFKKNIALHVKRLHNVPIRKQNYRCDTCSKIFYLKYTLQLHKCTG